MHASEDLRSRFAASQRTVGHLTRNLITAQLKLHAPKLHATTENSLSSSAALEAQEALLSRHQTYAHACPLMPVQDKHVYGPSTAQQLQISSVPYTDPTLLAHWYTIHSFKRELELEGSRW